MQISFAVTAKLISAFVFATRIVQFIFYLNPKFRASGSFLCLYRPVCVGPVQKPHCWFSHEAAHLLMLCFETCPDDFPHFYLYIFFYLFIFFFFFHFFISFNIFLFIYFYFLQQSNRPSILLILSNTKFQLSCPRLLLFVIPCNSSP